ncbi:L,D-transpeptidase [Puniceibacterium sp. IMCC21224]|uniref:L,D-transpeptidase n=1 Tax=Puniceibacterium sp. IMCC21224 TaxID=1618204 RepID=UPI00065D6559|nr:L,D-transpeptidase [Puniceibacterium sp. IMCC21224]KMK65707.1 protein exported by TAT pathway,Ykud domain-containing protein [Puniceibacterium sp. IMCC21224]
MISRRHFIAAAAAAAVLPTLPAQAQGFQVAPKFAPQSVNFLANYAPGQILIVPKAHFLYYITAPGQALRYGVGVGKAGLEFTGTATISVKKEWPTWRPTNEMIEREPQSYSKFKDNDYVQPGGPGNPLGARALYLFQNGRDTYFRIHGTTAPETIGRSVSNGCIRMLNEHVTDLYERIPIGTTVTVL